MIGKTISYFRITEKLGEGGMGVVYRAEDLKLDRTVALKFLAPEFVRDPEAKARFVHEAKAASALDHPNICTIHGIEETPDGSLFIAMACYEGQTLNDLITRGPLEVTQAAGIALQVAQGLAKAHSLGIVHRDIKPANIFITNDGLVKLLDFGIAKLAGSTQVTRQGTLLGSVHYMSPEQLRGETVDRRSDLWSLGVVLYEMLTGQPPFSGDNQPAVAYAIIHLEMKSLEDKVPGLPDDLARLVTLCLRKEVAERPQGAEALLQILNPQVGSADPTYLTKQTTGQHRQADSRGVKPYPGLASFSEKDAEYFHGRESQVEETWQKLRRLPLLAVTGPSGVGKTSFLRAGLLPAKPREWGVLLVTPGGSPFLSLREVLVRELSGDTKAMLSLLRENDLDTDVDVIRRWRQRHDEALLIIDQFEELFTLSPEVEQARFAALLSRLTFEADVHVVLSLRDDFLFRCREHAGLAPVFESLTVLLPLSGGDLRRALVRPAQDCGYRFDDTGLVDEMMTAVKGERGALPLLAFAMAGLWERRDREQGLITRQAYGQIGEVGGALARHAEGLMERVGTERQALVREIFRNLVTGQGTRTVLDREQLLSVFPASERLAAEEVLDQLIAARLLTSFETKGEDGLAHHRVEIVHESLLSAWPQLVRWQTQDADGAQLRDQLRQAAQLWEQKNRSDDLLWTGTAFREFQLWQDRYSGGLSSSEESYARAMTKRAERRKKRRRLAVSGAFLVLLAVLGVVGMSRQQAIAEARRALASEIVALGRMDLGTSPTAALTYAIRSLQEADSDAARLLALEALAAGPPATVLEMGPDADRVHDVVFSPDGSWAALRGFENIQVVSRDGKVRRSLQPLAALSVPHAAFDPQGQRLFGCSDDELRTWSVPGFELEDSQPLPEGTNDIVATRSSLYVLTRPTGTDEVVISAYAPGGELSLVGRVKMTGSCSIDRQGTWLAYAQDGDLFVRSLATWGQPPRRIGHHDQAVSEVQFVGDRVAVQVASGEIWIWSVDGEVKALGGFPSEKSGFWISDAEGDRLAVCATQPSFEVTLWDTRAPRRSTMPIRHISTVAPVAWGHYFNGAALVPGGEWVATANVNVLSFWPLTSARPRILAEHASGSGLVFRDVEFTPDGRQLLAILMDWQANQERIEVWDLAAGGASRTLASVPIHAFPRLAVDPQGRFVAVTTVSGAAIVPLAGGPVRHLSGYAANSWIGDIALDGQGRRLALCCSRGATAEKVIRIWDLETETVTVLGPIPDAGEDDAGGTMGLGFLPDGNLVSAGRGGLRIWNVDENTCKVVAPCHCESGVVIFGGGRYIASTGSDLPEFFPQVTDLEAGTTTVFPSRGGPFIAIDPSESVLAYSSFDAGPSVKVGPVNGDEPHLLFGQGPTIAVAISPDGRWIASCQFQSDATVWLWPMPDVSQPPLQTLPRDQLLAKLQALTNLRAAPDPASFSGWKLEVGAFPGWEKAPAW